MASDVEVIGQRMMVMVPRPVALVITDADKQAACDLIGNDSYGKPVWTVETISPENRVVQAFARHRLSTLPERDALREALERVVDWHGERGADDQLLPAEAQPEWIADAMRAIAVSRKFRITEGGRSLVDVGRKHADSSGIEAAAKGAEHHG